MTAHPSELKLERHLLDPDRSPVRDHVESCGKCRERIARMDKEGEDFRRFVYPATLEAVSSPRRSRWWALLALAPAAAAAAALVLLVKPAGDYVGTKGAALTLVPFLEGPREVSNGDAVPAAAALRFRVSAATTCRLWLLSVDGSGTVSRLYPPKGAEGVEIRGQTTTPGGVRLDGKAGPERFYAVCAKQILGYDRVEQAAREVAAGGAVAVRKTEVLPGLPGDTAQSSVLVEKRQ